jgi:hypothetical protein
MQTLKSAIRFEDETALDSLLDNLWAYVSQKISAETRQIFGATLAQVRASSDVKLKLFVFCHMLCHSERELDVREMVQAATRQPVTDEEVRLLDSFFRAAYEECLANTRNEPVDVVAAADRFFTAFNHCVP